jgi:hypothetical protein
MNDRFLDDFVGWARKASDEELRGVLARLLPPEDVERALELYRELQRKAGSAP